MEKKKFILVDDTSILVWNNVAANGYPGMPALTPKVISWYADPEVKSLVILINPCQ